MFCVYGAQVTKDAHTLEITTHVFEIGEIIQFPDYRTFVWLAGLYSKRYEATTAQAELVEQLVASLTGEDETQSTSSPDLHIVFATMRENATAITCKFYQVSHRFAITLEADEALVVLIATPNKQLAQAMYKDPTSAINNALMHRNIGRHLRPHGLPSLVTRGEA